MSAPLETYQLRAYDRITVTGMGKDQTWARTATMTQERIFRLGVPGRVGPRFTVPADDAGGTIEIAKLNDDDELESTDRGLRLPAAALPTGSELSHYEYTMIPDPEDGLGLTFTVETRVLDWDGTSTLAVTPTVTHVYGIRRKPEGSTSGTGEPLAALCVDLRIDDGGDGMSLTWRIRDEAINSRDAWVCNARDLVRGEESESTSSNPVHSALSPVHGRRTVGVAHRAVAAAVRNRVASSAPRGFGELDLASLSGRAGGFAVLGPVARVGLRRVLRKP